MSFFEQQGDDSNLQYDDTAFLYFFSSLLVCLILTLTCSIVGAFSRLSIPHEKQLSKTPAFKDKLRKMKSIGRERIITFSLLAKILLLLLCCGLLVWIYQISITSENSLKGFDPYQILEVNKDASLREIKKAYRRLAILYHPDKNKGDVQAQNKFILISKSYECFTNQEKKANCFKYGNPDGEGAYRVGIGLPHFFIDKQYQLYVLPVVLLVLLVLLPWAVIRWNSKTRTLDHNGISVGSYPNLFKAIQPQIDKFTIPYILASYTELSEDLNLGSINSTDKEQLEEHMKKNPHMDRPVFHEMSGNQLKILWEVISYSSNLRELNSSALRDKIEEFLSKTLQVVLMFTEKRLHGASLFDNPEWTIKYQGITAFNAFIEFQRDYYNRTFAIPNSNDNWLYCLGLTEEERNTIKQAIRDKKVSSSIYQIISSATQIRQLVSYLPEAKRSTIEEQLKTWPVYRIDTKLKVENQEVRQLTNMDYGEVYFKVQQLNKTAGYSYIHNHPVPVKDKIYVIGIEKDSFVVVKEVQFEGGSYVNKVEYRTGDEGVHPIVFFVLHQCCWSIDIITKLDITVTKKPDDQVQPIHFHKEDIHLQKLYRNVLEEAMDLAMDPEQNELSDQEDEEQENEEGDQNLPQYKHKHRDGHQEHGNHGSSDRQLEESESD